jgi:hypothetical protein
MSVTRPQKPEPSNTDVANLEGAVPTGSALTELVPEISRAAPSRKLLAGSDLDIPLLPATRRARWIQV